MAPTQSGQCYSVLIVGTRFIASWEVYRVTARTQRKEHCEEATVLAEKIISAIDMQLTPFSETTIYFYQRPKSTMAHPLMQAIPLIGVIN